MIDIKEAISVSKVNTLIKQMFDSNYALKHIVIKGEVSNFKRYSSGHVYFTLKDEQSVIKAVMFADYARYLNPHIENGTEVVACGRISVYQTRGEYQIYVESMELFGNGAQLLQLEMLKKKLAAEGLFDESRKRKINLFPRVVGVICAPKSAAMADIKTNLLRRYPLLEVKEFPSLVQGSEAVKDLLRSLNEAKNSNLDTLIIGRGGGASEDLGAFNDETLVREVAKFPVPVISAVGHEIDFTLIDYVADARASTPTGAAELATIDKRELYQQFDSYKDILDEKLKSLCESYKFKIDSYKKRNFFLDPKSMYGDKLIQLNSTKDKLDLLVKHLIGEYKNQIKSKSEHLKSLSPDNVLNRGYSIIIDKNGSIVKSINDISINDEINTKFIDGCIKAKVISKGK